MREGGAGWERSAAGSQCRLGASVVPIMVFLRPLVIVTFYALAMTTVSSQEEQVWSVTGVAGRASDLPCYLNPRTPGDRPKLILWYKRGIRTPVFTAAEEAPLLSVPSLSVPSLSVPSLSVPFLSVPSLSVPSLSVPFLSVPFLSVPSLPVPSLSVPFLSVPSLPVPSLSVPSLSVPFLSVLFLSVPFLSVPFLSVPSVSVPSLSVRLSVPSLSVPSLSVPSLSVRLSVPSLSVPSLSVPFLSVPSLPVPSLSVPSLSVPSLSVPFLSVPFLSVPSLPVPPLSVPFLSVPSVSIPSLSVHTMMVSHQQPVWGTRRAGGSRRLAPPPPHALTSVWPGLLAACAVQVDFFRSPSHNSLVNLTIIEPPRSVEVHDSQTGRAEQGLVGPYHEGQKVILSCIAKRGSPLPNVTWWREDRLLDATWEVADDGRPVVNNTLVVERLTREWHNATLTCAASNTHLADPLTTSVVVRMLLLPTSVVIRGSGPTREGGTAELICTSRGSRPPANLTWAFEGKTLHAVKQDSGYVGNGMSTSRLLVNVTREHHGSTVACVATNPTRPDAPITNSTTLTVHYAPQVNATMGQSFDPSLLREGVDVYFDCLVSANPPATPITWYHEGKVLVQNRTGGVILAGNSLALQGVRRSQAGRYTCSATNQLGHATSDPVTLRIKYSPECLSRPTAYFIYDKPINVTCTVSSYPAVNVILWQWNNSNEVIETQSVVVDQDRASAQLTVRPLQSHEDRKLSCWAVNEMGKQSQPCDFAVKVAKTPLPLSSCRLANITASSLSLTCQRPDLNAADTTLYRAEVYFQNMTLFANVTSHRPNFNVSSLDAGTSYQIKVYVTHGPVTSQPVVVSAYTSRTSRTPQGDAGGGQGGGSVGGVVGGVVVTLVLLAGVVAARNYCKRKRSRRKQEQRPPSDDSNPDVVPNIEETYDLLSAAERKVDVVLYEAVDSSVPEDLPAHSMGQGSEAYRPLVRTHSPQEVDEYQGGVRGDVYCPVDQMMQAEESVV
ncbi:neural cell adhesion molecule 1-like [Eriocheir sinensis]|uniref:neural cell adhesion molecule 1-like n=1 Tax=Eriocheir sinensis TaxID=95602 RepID=UPI0021C89372|nr:neural cell adhesion molecule 1-like [Eriocheir sinensis]